MKMGFDGGIKLEFYSTEVKSNGGLLAHRDLDYAFGLFVSDGGGLDRQEVVCRDTIQY